VKVAAGLIAIVLAIALQSTLAGFLIAGTVAFDLVLVVVVYIALSAGPVGGMFAGTLAGLVQDALSTGVIGIGGLAKTIVGFLVGVFGQQFIVTAPLPRFVMFLAASMLHSAISIGLYVLLGLRTFPASPWAAVTGQAVGNAAVGMIAFTLVERLPGAMERRRMTKRVRD
jgi:rod shape-determining protein MreD